MRNIIKLTKKAIADYRAEIQRSRALDAQMERSLIDSTLLDRMSQKPKKLIVRDADEPQEIPVRVLRRPLSLDGILAPAC